MRDQTYLLRRGSVYYFQRKIPAELREEYPPGQLFIKESLGTSNKEEAKRKARKRAVETDQDFSTKLARKGSEVVSELSQEKIAHLCDLWEAHILEEDEEVRIDGLTDRDFAKLGESIEAAGDGLQAALARGKFAGIEWEMQDFISSHGVKLQPSSPSFGPLRYAFLKAWVKANKKLAARHQGEPVDTPSVAPIAHAKVARKAARGEERLEDLLAHWAKQAERRPKTLDEFSTAIQRLRKITGNIAAKDVEKHHLVRFRDELKQQGKAAATVKKQVGALAAIFQQAANDSIISTNPVIGVKVKRGPKSNKNDAWSLEEVRALLASPIFAQGKRPKAGAGEAAYWLPVLGLFHGLRMGEAGQLRAEDILEQDGIHYMRLTADSDGNSLKNAGSARRIPIHPQVLKAGFLGYVKAQGGRGGEKRLFPDLVPDCHGVLTGNYSKWFGRYLDGVGLGHRTFHGLRGTFKHFARECEIMEEHQDALTGHFNDTVARTYGDAMGYPLRPLAKAISKLSYPGVEVPRWASK